MREAIPPLPSTPSWRGAELKKKTLEHAEWLNCCNKGMLLRLANGETVT
jgi:hypothetical protein